MGRDRGDHFEVFEFRQGFLVRLFGGYEIKENGDKDGGNGGVD